MNMNVMIDMTAPHRLSRGQKAKIDDPTTQDILHQIATDTEALNKAVLILYNSQTSNEQVAKESNDFNMKGLRACHAKRITTAALHLMETGNLSEDDTEWLRGATSFRPMRIGTYWFQFVQNWN